jgi:hypothetical protein
VLGVANGFARGPGAGEGAGVDAGVGVGPGTGDGVGWAGSAGGADLLPHAATSRRTTERMRVFTRRSLHPARAESICLASLQHASPYRTAKPLADDKVQNHERERA